MLCLVYFRSLCSILCLLPQEITLFPVAQQLDRHVVSDVIRCTIDSDSSSWICERRNRNFCSLSITQAVQVFSIIIWITSAETDDDCKLKRNVAVVAVVDDTSGSFCDSCLFL